MQSTHSCSFPSFVSFFLQLSKNQVKRAKMKANQAKKAEEEAKRAAEAEAERLADLAKKNRQTQHTHTRDMAALDTYHVVHSAHSSSLVCSCPQLRT